MLTTVDTPWNVQFQPKRGAPAEAVFDKLYSYSENADAGIKYFSGIASYTNTFKCGLVQGKVTLDLGKVADLAEVYVNGQYCGAAWKEPYRVDVTAAVKEGTNQLEVKVANVWVNRLIGDEQPGATRIAYTDSRSGYRAESKLNPAGLLDGLTAAHGLDNLDLKRLQQSFRNSKGHGVVVHREDRRSRRCEAMSALAPFACSVAPSLVQDHSDVRHIQRA